MTDGDLISRQAVLDIFGDIHPLDYNAKSYVTQIKELPSTEKTAEWHIVGKTTLHYECSKCGGAGDKWDKFCKHCGARMTNQECDNNHDCEHCDWTECPLEAEKEAEGAK